LGFLYVAPRHQQGRPLEHNWIVRAGSENFAGLVNYRDEMQPGARRFDVGERSNFALMPMARRWHPESTGRVFAAWETCSDTPITA